MVNTHLYMCICMYTYTGTNDFSGSIPTELSTLDNLIDLTLRKLFYWISLFFPNPYFWPLPAPLLLIALDGNSNLTKNQDLDPIFCHDGRLRDWDEGWWGFYSDCLRSSVKCSCCTHCCDGDEDTCIHNHNWGPEWWLCRNCFPLVLCLSEWERDFGD